MTNERLGLSYLHKVRVRIKALHVLAAEEGYSDVVCECQESYDLLLKAVLRVVAIDPPKWHDVDPILRENAAKLPSGLRMELGRITAASSALGKERELAF
jgi:HEPN domain-containing protein